MTIVDNGSPYSHVALLDLYLSKVPRAEIDNDNLFYLSPLPFTPLRELKWYFNDPFSSKLLSNLLKTMTTEAGLEGNFTNHSLRATYRRERGTNPLMHLDATKGQQLAKIWRCLICCIRLPLFCTVKITICLLHLNSWRSLNLIKTRI